MNVVIFGATGKTGQHVWPKALEKGHKVSVFVRSPHKIESTHENLTVIKGDVFDTSSVASAMAGHDAAIVCLGSAGLRDKTTLTEGTTNVISGMKDSSAQRLIVISAAGVEESWSQIPFMSRILFKTMLRNIFADHLTQEAAVKASDLQWTIVRAAILNDKPSSGEYTASNTAPNRRISRTDLADFLVTQLTDTRYIHEAISVTS